MKSNHWGRSLVLVLFCVFCVAMGGAKSEQVPAITALGMNKYRVAFLTSEYGSDDFTHMFDLGTMQLDDGRLQYMRFKTIKTEMGAYSLTFPVKHNNHAILDLRHLGALSCSFDWGKLEGKRHNVFGFFSQDKWLSGGENGSLFLYNTKGEKIAVLKGHSGMVTALASYDNWLVSGDNQGLIILWNMEDVRSGKQQLAPYLYMIYASSGEWAIWADEGRYAISPEGRSLLSVRPGVAMVGNESQPELLAKKITNPKQYFQDVGQGAATGF